MRRGFTLIEMMISVAIVGILAALALPSFVTYQYKAKTVEARTLLGGVITSQEAFSTEFDNNANIAQPVPPAVPGPTRTGWIHIPCDPACSRYTPAACSTFECIGFAAPTAVYYQLASPSRFAGPGTTPEYAVGAAGDIDGDGVNGSFAYRSTHSDALNGVVADGISACTAGITAGIVTNCLPAEF